MRTTGHEACGSPDNKSQGLQLFRSPLNPVAISLSWLRSDVARACTTNKELASTVLDATSSGKRDNATPSYLTYLGNIVPVALLQPPLLYSPTVACVE